MIKMDLEMFKPQPELHPQPEFQPEPEQSDYPDFANEFSDLDPTRNPPSHSQSQGNVAPSFPKSLLLLQHLFSSYSLRPLPSEVQKRVRLPDKLDLNEWFVPPSKQELETSDNRERKKKKIKGKTKDGAEKGKSQSHIHSTHTPYTDDQLEKEAENITSVSPSLSTVLWPNFVSDVLTSRKMRAERLARQKEDPYYLKESRPASRSQRSHHDIDSIPIVKLDDMPPLIIGTWHVMARHRPHSSADGASITTRLTH
jgi:AP-3 complex subunit delta-1